MYLIRLLLIVLVTLSLFNNVIRYIISTHLVTPQVNTDLYMYYLEIAATLINVFSILALCCTVYL